MGYKGRGLGINEQGMTTSLQLQQKNTKGGLGYEETRQLPSIFKPQKHQSEDSIFPHEQAIEFLKSKSQNFNQNIFKFTISTENENPLNSPFCQKDLIKEIMQLKSEFDELADKDFVDARYRSNPYEKIGKSIFQNRAAIKMANIDKVTKITEIPKLEDEKSVLFFADICAGPGGFTEFIYYKYKEESAKGFGFTLKGKDDFKLDKFNSESPHSNFEVSYGADGTGDILNNDNIIYFSDFIDKGTNGRGVALVTADGGISVQGIENQQETITKQLVLCQVIMGLTILRKGGNFMIKVFDLFTHFSISICYLLFQCFESFGIFKPFSSRPANSERYIICKNLKTRKPGIVKSLMELNTKMSQKQNVFSFIDQEVVSKDEEFIDYINVNNILIGKKQVKFLQRLKKCVEDPYLDSRKSQFDLRKRCLEFWGLPVGSTTKNSKPIPEKRSFNDYKEFPRKKETNSFQKPVQFTQYKPIQFTPSTTQPKKEEVVTLSKEEQEEQIRKRHKGSIEEWREVDKSDEQNETEENVDLEKVWQE